MFIGCGLILLITPIPFPPFLCFQPSLSSSHFSRHAVLPFHFRSFPGLYFSDLHPLPHFVLMSHLQMKHPQCQLERMAYDGLASSARGIPAFLHCIEAALSLAPVYLPSLILNYFLKHTLSSAILLYSLSPECAFMHIIKSIRTALLSYSIVYL